MKKYFVIFLIFVFAFCEIPGVLAQGTGFTQEQFRKLLGENAFEPTFEYLRLVGDRFYDLEKDGNIYAWKINEDEISLFCRVDLFDKNIKYTILPPAEKEKAGKTVTHLFEGENKLWAYNIFSGCYGAVTEKGVEWTRQSNVKDENWCPRETGDIIGGFAVHDVMYFVYKNSLYALSEDCEKEFLLPVNIMSFQPYKENYAIALADSGVNYDICQINLFTGEVSKINRSLPEDEMAFSCDYIKESDKLFIMAMDSQGNIKIYSSVKDEDFIFNGLLLEQGSIVNLNDEEYALVEPSGIYINKTENMFKTDKTVLTICGIGGYPYASQNFMRENPDVLVREVNSDFSQDELVKIITESSDVDIYSMFANRLFKAIKEKEYAEKMNSSEKLILEAEKMYPIFQKTIKDKNGDIIAWPGAFSVYKVMSVDAALWRECFGKRPYPKTFIEMFNTMAEWESKFAKRYEDAVVYSASSMDNLLFQMIYKYCGMYETQEKAVDFDTEIFRNTLSAYEKMLSVTDLERQKYLWESYDEENRIRALFRWYGLSTDNYSLFNPEESDYFMPWPTFTEDEKPVIEVSTGVLWINRNSKNKDIALKYIEYLTESCNKTPEIEYSLEKGHTEPVENKNYILRTQELNMQKEKLQKAKEEAKDEYKDAFDEAIAQIDANLEDLEDNRYKITNEGIERYASWLPYFKSTLSSNYLTQNEDDEPFTEEVYKLCSMFVQKAISSEQIISRLNQVSKLVFAERK